MTVIKDSEYTVGKNFPSVSKEDLEFTSKELDLIEDMATFYFETEGLEETENYQYRIIAMKCEERLKTK